jgi:hypothetical protein
MKCECDGVFPIEPAMTDDERFGIKDWLRLLGAIALFLVFVKWPHMTFAVVLLVIGGVMIAFNAMIFWLTVVRKGEAPAVAPIFGGIIAAIGVAVLPAAESWKWAWVPLAIDWGGLPGLVAAVIRRRS